MRGVDLDLINILINKTFFLLKYKYQFWNFNFIFNVLLETISIVN